MKVLRIVFTDQLSKNNPALADLTDKDFILFYEPMDTFYEIDHHKQKIVFLISSLRNIIKNNKHKNIIHRKISKKNALNLIKYLKELISTEGFTKIIVSKPSDFQIKTDLMFFSQSNNIA